MIIINNSDGALTHARSLDENSIGIREEFFGTNFCHYEPYFQRENMTFRGLLRVTQLVSHGDSIFTESCLIQNLQL